MTSPPTATEPTGFLYPFLDAAESGTEELLADLARSAREKAATSWELRRQSVARSSVAVNAAAEAMAARFAAGGRLLCFGNGGSATDAATAEALFARNRPDPDARILPARNLTADPAVLTAVGNDVGIDAVFSRQLLAHGRPVDIALGLSTSGNSANLLAAFAEARRLGLLTVGLAGYSGGQMASSGLVDHCLVVESDSVHRIQEAQHGLLQALWVGVHGILASSPTSPGGAR